MSAPLSTPYRVQARRQAFLGCIVLIIVALATTTVAVSPTSAAGGRSSASPTAPAFDIKPIQQLLQRVLSPQAARSFELVALSPGAHGVEDPAQEWFQIGGVQQRIRIEATTTSAMLRGVKQYLAEVAGVDISWNGDSLNQLPAELPLPSATITGRAGVQHRFSGNDTEDGYTGAFRTWKDWQHELDVLALHGINEIFIPVGTEAVYLDTFQQFGYSEAELLEWIPQPTHQPWWLLQNICCFPSPMTRAEVEQRAELGRKIADHARSLGMTPVLPGYFGTVPDGFSQRNGGANVIPQGGWVGFERPGWLDPTGETFAAVAAAFYESSERRLGASSMYKMDLLHEGGRAGDVDVADASRGVESALQAAHPGAIWAILGWQNNPRPATLDGIDTSKMLIVDGLSDRYNGLDRERDWRGTPYAFGSIWNFGGHTTMGANIGVWNQRFWEWKHKANSALDGIAVLPEAGDNNPVALEFLAGLAWSEGPEDMATWYAAWSARRYGEADPAAVQAWQTLGATAYSMPSDGWSEAQDGLFAAQPSLTVGTAATWSPTSMRYDAAQFAGALPELLAVAPQARNSTAYRYDLADVARQVLSNRSRGLLPRIKTAYDTGDRQAFDSLTTQWLAAMDLVDRLGATNEQTMLGAWLADARADASDEESAQRREHAARTLLTVWGNRSGNNAGLHDYANREWAGLVGTFYKKRWERYFAELHAAMTENREPRAIDWYAMGEAWAAESSDLPARSRGDVHAVASEVLDFLRAHPVPLTVATTVDPESVTADSTSTLSIRVTNPDAFATVRGVDVAVTVPAGIGVESTGTLMPTELSPGQEATATYDLRVEDPEAVADLVSTIMVTVGAEGQELVVRRARVLLGTGVQAPHQTVSFNDAQFAQRGTSYAIAAGGADLWGGTKAFGAIYRNDVMRDSVSVTTQVTSQDRTGPWARAGLIVRDDLSSQNARGFLNLALTPDHGCVLSWDSNNDGTLDAYQEALGFGPGVHLRLSRIGDRYTAECSRDGDVWTQVATVELPSADLADVGLFMTAASSARGIATFEGFAMAGASTPQPPRSGTHYLSDLPFAATTSEHGPWERDMHNGETAPGDGGPIVLNGTTYAKGLGTNSNASLVVYLGGGCTRFTSVVGIDDTMDRADAQGDVVVEVWADDQRLYVSDVLVGGGTPARVDVDLTEAHELRLVVKQHDVNNWWDRTDWADAQIRCS